MKFQRKEQYEPETTNTGSVLSTVASLILMLGMVWLAISALAGCTPTY